MCVQTEEGSTLHPSLNCYLAFDADYPHDVVTHIDQEPLQLFATAPLMPLAFAMSKVIGVDFQNKENP